MAVHIQLGALVELKALNGLANVDYAQIINYLKAPGRERGLLLNFGTPRLQVQALHPLVRPFRRNLVIYTIRRLIRVVSHVSSGEMVSASSVDDWSFEPQSIWGHLRHLWMIGRSNLSPSAVICVICG